MRITEVKIFPADPRRNTKLLAYAELVFDDAFVVHEVRIIKRNDGSLLVAMPSRVTTDHCPECSGKNQVNQAYCGHCGVSLDPERQDPDKRLYQDYAHPITAPLREHINREVLASYSLALSSAALPPSRKAVAAC